MHDVAIASLPVVFCVDRAGVVGPDGVTHQGVFDIALLRALPNLEIFQPCDERELRRMLEQAIRRKGPTVIRYPRGTLPPPYAIDDAKLAVQLVRPEADVQIWALGDWLGKALQVADRIGAGVVYARGIKPFDRALLEKQRREGKRIVSLENGSIAGGFGEALGADVKIGWPDDFIPHGSCEELEKHYALDVASLVALLSR
jgi:1-deoxy-D-xylulose-5-phosphate synthase